MQGESTPSKTNTQLRVRPPLEDGDRPGTLPPAGQHAPLFGTFCPNIGPGRWGGGRGRRPHATYIPFSQRPAADKPGAAAITVMLVGTSGCTQLFEFGEGYAPLLFLPPRRVLHCMRRQASAFINPRR